jgi:hypothetical protein
MVGGGWVVVIVKASGHERKCDSHEDNDSPDHERPDETAV